MKIGMMCLWNAANGPSIHAELIGRAWLLLGRKLTVFSAKKHPDDRPTDQNDEDYVIRHFQIDEVIPVTRASQFDPSPLLNKDYNVFVAQNLERLPAEKLLEVFPEIRKKAITCLVVHEGKAPEDPFYYKFDWDAVVCFDQRYRNYLIKSFPPEKIHMIPYPCKSLALGDKKEARKSIGLHLDEKIVFSFGFRPKDIVAVLPTLEDVAKECRLRYIIIANPESEVQELQKTTKKYDFIDLQVRPLAQEELYTYLHASDVLLIHRESSTKYHAVVSSSICQVLGSGCPILFHESNYVEYHGDEILKYKDFNDLKDKLIDVFNNKYNLEKVKLYLEQHGAERIANRYLELFEDLMKVREKK